MPEDFSFIPRPFATITAYTSVKDAAGLIDFTKTVFGAVELKRVPRPDGTLQHAQVTIGNSVLMLSDATDQWPAMPVNLYLYLAYTDAAYQSALDNGATSLMAPADQPYGDRMSGVKDPYGNSWWIATPLRQN